MSEQPEIWGLKGWEIAAVVMFLFSVYPLALGIQRKWQEWSANKAAASAGFKLSLKDLDVPKPEVRLQWVGPKKIVVHQVIVAARNAGTLRSFSCATQSRLPMEVLPRQWINPDWPAEEPHLKGIRADEAQWTVSFSVPPDGDRFTLTATAFVSRVPSREPVTTSDMRRARPWRTLQA